MTTLTGKVTAVALTPIYESQGRSRRRRLKPCAACKRPYPGNSGHEVVRLVGHSATLTLEIPADGINARDLCGRTVTLVVE